MGVLITRDEDSNMYKDTYEEAQRIIRISDEVRISLEKIDKSPAPEAKKIKDNESSDEGKLASGKVAKHLGLSLQDFLAKLVSRGYLLVDGKGHTLTESGADAGGEFIPKARFGAYFLWPINIDLG